MVAVNIKAFRGEVPRLSDRLLQPNQATKAINCKVSSGRLEPLRGLLPVGSSALNNAQTLFRYKVAGNPDQFYWMLWADDTDTVPSMLAQDDRSRLFFTGSTGPRMTTAQDAIVGLGTAPAASFVLGVSNPQVAPTVGVAGGTAPTETRAYLYTFVTQFGEESGPSPATVFTGNANGTWSLSNMQVTLPNSGTVTGALANTPVSGQVRVQLNTVLGLTDEEFITFASVGGMTALNGTHRILSVDTTNSRVVIALDTSQTYTSGGTWTRVAAHNTAGLRKRIYRSAGTTNARYLFVDEIDASLTDYTDIRMAAQLGEPIPTLASLPPPKNLTSLIGLPNGCLAGLAGNELCFSDPYLPHSWPLANRYSFTSQGVALAAAGNSVIVLTDGFPLVATGSDPEAMSITPMETYAPCVSKRGVVSIGGGCLYPSYDGLWLAAPGRVDRITKNLFREEEWSRLAPTTMVAEFHDGRYYACYRPPNDPAGHIFVLDTDQPDSVTFVGEEVSTLLRNPYDGELYVVKGTQILQWDALDSRRYDMDWKSMTFQMGKPTSFAVAQVHADFDAIVPIDTSQLTANQALMAQPTAGAGFITGNEVLGVEINGSDIVPILPPLQRRVQFTLHRDGRPVFTKQVSSTQPFRLPAGVRGETFAISIAASVDTYSATIAESVTELKQASA